MNYKTLLTHTDSDGDKITAEIADTDKPINVIITLNGRLDITNWDDEIGEAAVGLPVEKLLELADTVRGRLDDYKAEAAQ